MLIRRDSSTRAEHLESAPDRIVHTIADALQHNPDAAIIASPATHHLQTAQPLAENGVHLFVEKPIADSIDGVDRLIAECSDNGCVLMTGYNLRFDPSLKALKSVIDDGLIGNPVGLRAEVGQYLPDWRPTTDYRDAVSANRSLGGGALLELSHELDYAQWLMGDITSVSAQVGQVSDLEIDVEDIAELNVRFGSGAIGNIHLDFVQRTPSRQCRIIGTEGTLIWDAIANTVRCFETAADEWSDMLITSTDRSQMYLDELVEFLAAINQQRQPCVTGEDGRRALAVVLAAKQSADEGVTVSVESAGPTVVCGTTLPHRTVGFVFARGGSKGLPGKNLRDLADKPPDCACHRNGEGERLHRPSRCLNGRPPDRLSGPKLWSGRAVHAST